MAYEVNKKDGTVLLNIQEGEVDTTYGLNLLGKNYLGYGELIAENFVWLLENFASTEEPPNPIPGQLWFSISTDQTQPRLLKVYHGNNVWKPLAHMFVNSAPGSSALSIGDMWYDSANQSIMVWNGTGWILPNNVYGAEGYETGMVTTEKIKDTGGNLHACVKWYVNGVLTMIVSSDSAYAPAAANLQTPVFDYTPFCSMTATDGTCTEFGAGTINRGINLNSASQMHKLHGVAVKADCADSLSAGASAVWIGPTPPASARSGALWWDNVSGNLKIYYDDGNTSQWVEAFSVGTGGTTCV